MAEIPSQPVLVIGASNAAERSILQGIEDYRTEQGLDWTILSTDPSSVSHWLAQLRMARGTNAVLVLGTVKDERLLDWAEAEGAVVATWRAVPGLGERVARVLPDPERIGATAAEYLVGSGRRPVCFWPVAMPRVEAFRRHCERLGVPATPIANKGPGWTTADVIANLRTIPPGACAFCHSDLVAAYLRDLCIAAGVKVPEHLAILGADDLAGVCEGRAPTLSSVRVPWRLIGRRLALLGHRGLCGETWRGRIEPVPPIGVHERQSTGPAADPNDPWPALDAELAGSDQPDVDRLAAAFGCSRRHAERHFHARHGMSLRAWYAQARCRRAIELLIAGDLSVSAVARTCGYTTLQGLGVAIRRATGLAPTELAGTTPDGVMQAVSPEHPIGNAPGAAGAPRRRSVDTPGRQPARGRGG